MRKRSYKKGGAYFNVDTQGVALTRGWRLLAARRLLEEIRYCIRLNLKKHNETAKIHYAYKKVRKVFSASSTRTNILIWKYINKQIM